MIHKLYSLGEEAVSLILVFLTSLAITGSTCHPKQVQCGDSESEAGCSQSSP